MTQSGVHHLPHGAQNNFFPVVKLCNKMRIYKTVVLTRSATQHSSFFPPLTIWSSCKRCLLRKLFQSRLLFSREKSNPNSDVFEGGASQPQGHKRLVFESLWHVSLPGTVLVHGVLREFWRDVSRKDLGFPTWRLSGGPWRQFWRDAILKRLGFSHLAFSGSAKETVLERRYLEKVGFSHLASSGRSAKETVLERRYLEKVIFPT